MLTCAREREIETMASCEYVLARVFQEPTEDKKVATLLTSKHVVGFKVKPHHNAPSASHLISKLEQNKIHPSDAGGVYTTQEHDDIYTKMVHLYAQRTPTFASEDDSSELKCGLLRRPLSDGLPFALEQYYFNPDKNVALVHALAEWYMHYQADPTLSETLGILVHGMCGAHCTDGHGAVLPYAQQRQTISEVCVPLINMQTLVSIAVRFQQDRVSQGSKSMSVPELDVEFLHQTKTSHEHIQPFQFASAGDYFFWLVVRHLGSTFQASAVSSAFPDTPRQLPLWFLPAPVNVQRLMKIKTLQLPDFTCCSSEDRVGTACRVAYPRRAYEVIAKSAHDVLGELFQSQLDPTEYKLLVPLLSEFIPLKLTLEIAEKAWSAESKLSPDQTDAAIEAITNVPICMDDMHTETSKITDPLLQKASTAYRLHALITDKVGFKARNTTLRYFYVYHMKVGLRSSPTVMAALVARHDDDPAYEKTREAFEQAVGANQFAFAPLS
jgi:hypothetical protein